MIPKYCLLPILLLLRPTDAVAEDSATSILVVGPAANLVIEAPTGARAEASIGGGPMLAIERTVRAPEAGDHWLAVASRTPEGYVSPIQWTLLRVDAEPPILEIRDMPNAWTTDDGTKWIPPEAEAVVEARDRPAGVGDLVLEAGGVRSEAANGATTASVVLPRDGGAVELRADAVDRVGNRTPTVSETLMVDAWPPTGRIEVVGAHVAGGDTGVVLGPATTLRLVAEDQGAGLAESHLEADGVEAPLERIQSPWAVGDHEARVRLVDHVGNQTSLDAFSFVVDAAPPDVQWRIDTPGAAGDDGEMVYLSPVGVTISARDALAGLETLVASDAQGATLASSAGADLTIQIDSDRLRVEAVDRVRNRAMVDAQWRLDDAPPTFRVIGPRGPMTASEVLSGDDASASRSIVVHRVSIGTRLRVEVVDTGAGIANAHYVLNRLTIPGTREPTTVDDEIVLALRGKYELILEAEDRLGHRAESRWRIHVGNPIGDFQ